MLISSRTTTTTIINTLRNIIISLHIIQQNYLLSPSHSFSIQPPPFTSFSTSSLKLSSSSSSLSSSSHDNDGTQTDKNNPKIYKGPVLSNPSEILTGVCLPDNIGLDLAIAPSTIAPGTLGLYAILSSGVTQTTLPPCTLLCGYSRSGEFQHVDEGDKTVGFILKDVDNAVFYERELMSVLDALTLAAETKGREKSCGLIGHALIQRDGGSEEEEGNFDLIPVDDDEELSGEDGKGWGRYFVPAYLNRQTTSSNDEEELSIQNLGQFCNDLAWNINDPPSSVVQYEQLSSSNNVIQLIWRLEYDETTNCLMPTWPVSVTTSERDVVFTNDQEFMELGTKYGWNYWQAVVDLENI